MNKNEIAVAPMEQSEIEAIRRVLAFLPPSTLAEIASEIAESSFPHANEIVEICFDIERGNNGAAEFMHSIITANR